MLSNLRNSPLVLGNDSLLCQRNNYVFSLNVGTLRCSTLKAKSSLFHFRVFFNNYSQTKLNCYEKLLHFDVINILTQKNVKISILKHF